MYDFHIMPVLIRYWPTVYQLFSANGLIGYVCNPSLDSMHFRALYNLFAQMEIGTLRSFIMDSLTIEILEEENTECTYV